MPEREAAFVLKPRGDVQDAGVAWIEPTTSNSGNRRLQFPIMYIYGSGSASEMPTTVRPNLMMRREVYRWSIRRFPLIGGSAMAGSYARCLVEQQ
jgi:hypothetical protein